MLVHLRRAGIRLAALAAVGIAAGCGPVRTAPPAATAIVAPTTLRVKVGDRIVSVPLEDYVLGSALAEISPTGESASTVSRVFDVQTILARTYAVAHLGRHRAEGFDVCDGTHCQLYEPARIGASRFTADARAAVARTRGQLLWYGERPIDALFHSDCGGYTDAPENIWGGSPLAYLRAQKDSVPTLTHRIWQTTISREALRLALDADPKTAIGARLDSIAVRTRDVSGRASEVIAVGAHTATIRGEDLRSALNRSLGAKGLLSTRFAITAKGSSYVFDGEGYGHGVGLCQAGALARARQGATAPDILAHYFPGSALGR